MTFDSRASVPFDTNNIPFEVRNGVAIPVGTPGFLVLGNDAGTARTVLVDPSGRPIINVGRWFDSSAPTVGQKPSADSIPVVLPNDQLVSVETEKSSTGTVTSVAASLVATTLLAANVNRLGASIFIESAGVNNVFVKMGAAATTTSYTVRLASGDYYEVPFGYTGIITAIWSPVAVGNARITEFT